MTISICIASYGAETWRDLAMSRAYPSALDQGAYEIIPEHQPDGTVSSSRNAAAENATGDWLCFCDADDELGPGYIVAMGYAADAEALASSGLCDAAGEPPRYRTTKTLLTPRVSNVFRHRRQPPKFWPECSLGSGNPLSIGTLVPRALFFSVGGFKDYGDPPGSNAYEDWSLWARCWKVGARVMKVPLAIYIAHWEESSRHRGVPNATKIAWHREIEHDLWPERCA